MTTATDMAPAAPETTPAPAPKQATLKQLVTSDYFKQQLAAALPRHCTPDRMARVALNAMLRTPDLLKCDQTSFVKAMLDLAKWGLEPDGRHAHLIPFKNRKLGIVECQLILDYKGIVQLIYRSGEVSAVHADVVYEGDDFEYSMGMVDAHRLWFLRDKASRPDKKGEIIAAYVRVAMKNGAVKCEVMSKDDIDAIRARSKASSSGPWVTDYAEMAKKTVFRRASKWLPVSAEMVAAFDRDFDTPAFTVDALPPGDDQGPKQLSDLADGVLGAEPDEAAPEPSQFNDLACPRCQSPLRGEDPDADPARYGCGTECVGGVVARIGKDCTPPNDKPTAEAPKEGLFEKDGPIKGVGQ